MRICDVCVHKDLQLFSSILSYSKMWHNFNVSFACFCVENFWNYLFISIIYIWCFILKHFSSILTLNLLCYCNYENGHINIFFSLHNLFDFPFKHIIDKQLNTIRFWFIFVFVKHKINYTFNWKIILFYLLQSDSLCSLQIWIINNF